MSVCHRCPGHASVGTAHDCARLAVVNVGYAVHARLSHGSSTEGAANSNTDLQRINISALTTNLDPLEASSLPGHRAPDVPLLLGLRSKVLPQGVLTSTNIHGPLLQHPLVVLLAEVDLCTFNVELLRRLFIQEHVLVRPHGLDRLD